MCSAGWVVGDGAEYMFAITSEGMAYVEMAK
jgi:hypothetical protein